MLSNKTQTEKSETFLLAHALLLFVLSLLVGVQGVFEIIDYMPHIISAGCINCGAYAASIPSTLIMYLWFSVSVAVFYYRESRKMFTLIPYMCIIGIAPSLVYDLSFISENGFISGGEYNVTLYLVMDIFLLLDSIVMIQACARYNEQKSRYDMSCDISYYGAYILFERFRFLRLGRKN
ncbi:MAG: hypothetical protein ACLS48_12205 [[Eubacterium] siraeum]